jgi:acyl-CoA thioesterase YciA
MAEATNESPRRHLALRSLMMPADTNPYGTIFGGVILSHIDQAGFVAARRLGVHRWVTASMEKVEFQQPVRLGDTVAFYTTITREGTTSVSVRVDVEAERFTDASVVAVTTATLTMVAVNATGRPVDFRGPATL